MKEEALKLAKYLDRLNGYMDMPRDILDITQPSSAMIRRLVEELDKKPLSDTEIIGWLDVYGLDMGDVYEITEVRFLQAVKAILERHGIK